MFQTFAQECLLKLEVKEQQAEAIIWFNFKKTGESDITIATINHYFKDAFLPPINVTRAKAAFQKSKNVCKGNKSDTYKLTLTALNSFDNNFGYIWKKYVEIKDLAGIYETPYLSKEEIEQAQKMAELYAILNCYENSARSLITRVLSRKLGESWWDTAANTSQKSKLKSRVELEEKHKWLTPRGCNPLYYIDWGDLLSIIRKYEPDFLPYVKDIKFVELRFEELERVRNIAAHNGYLPNEEDFQRVVLSFRDWCRQIKSV
ncbi:Swt1 family HEPN domain-containing protein [Caproiciproducens sp.]